MTPKNPTLILISMAIIICTGLTGCRTRAGTPVPTGLALPETYTRHTEGITPAGEWWKSLDSEELPVLIETGLENNPDLEIYRARARQAAAVLEKTGAGLLPALAWSADVQEKISHTKPSHTSRATSADSQAWTAGIAVSFDPDIWGSLAAEQKADLLAYEAAVEDLNDTASRLCTDIMTTYADIGAARQKIRILESQIHINEKLLALQKLRFTNGKSSALDVSQQREALASAKAQIPPVKKQKRLLVNTLNALLGRFTDTGMIRFSDSFSDRLDLPESSVPATLLENRPDIRAAQLRLRSANLDVSVAESDLLPSLSLSASALFSSGKLDLLFENWMLSLAASITGPIFDAGRRKAEVQRTLAAVEEKLAAYRKIVIQAFREVENTLAALEQQRQYIRLLEEQLASARITLADARVQYTNGQSNYLSYLTAWSGIQRLEIQLVTEKTALVKEKIALFRALGMSTPDMALSVTVHQ